MKSNLTTEREQRERKRVYMKVKDTIVKEINDIKQILVGAKELVLAVSLVICAGYNWYDLTIRPVGKVEFYIRTAASLIIALIGANEALKVFKRIGAK